MKYILAFFIFISPVFVAAQTAEYVTDSLVKQKWEELKSSWTFGLPKTGNGTVDIRVFNTYKSLFDSTAFVASDIDAVYKYGEKSAKEAYKLNPDTTFDSYAHGIALHFNSFNIETDSQPLDKDSEKNEIIYTIIRKVTGEKKGEFVVEDKTPFLDSIDGRKKI